MNDVLTLFRRQLQASDRVRNETPASVRDRIDRETVSRIAELRDAGDPGSIHRRLAQLDHEWNIDRAVMMNFAVVGGAAFAAGVSGRRGWLALFSSQIAFLALHAVNGWCPPTMVMRRMGVRTQLEIEAERAALRSLLEARSAPSSERLEPPPDAA